MFPFDDVIMIDEYSNMNIFLSCEQTDILIYRWEVYDLVMLHYIHDPVLTKDRLSRYKNFHNKDIHIGIPILEKRQLHIIET